MRGTLAPSSQCLAPRSLYSWQRVCSQSPFTAHPLGFSCMFWGNTQASKLVPLRLCQQAHHPFVIAHFWTCSEDFQDRHLWFRQCWPWLWAGEGTVWPSEFTISLVVCHSSRLNALHLEGTRMWRILPTSSWFLLQQTTIKQYYYYLEANSTCFIQLCHHILL